MIADHQYNTPAVGQMNLGLVATGKTTLLGVAGDLSKECWKDSGLS